MEGRAFTRTIRRIGSSGGTGLLIVIVMALGIGGIAALLAVVDGVWLKAVPYRDASRLFLISVRTPFSSTDLVSWSELARWRTGTAGRFAQMAAYAQARNVAVETDHDTRAESVRSVEPSFFTVLGEAPLIGRFLTEQDRLQTSPIPIVITEGLWRRRFGASVELESQRVSVDGARAVVIGVVPERIRSIQSSTILRAIRPPDGGSAGVGSLRVLARFGHATSAAGMQRALDSSPGDATDRQRPPRGAAVVSLRDAVLGVDVGRILLLVIVVAGLALLVACADVTLLVLSGMSRKAQELRIKMALGASRGRLIRELMAVGLLAAALGASLGLVLAAATRGWLVSLMPPSMPRASEIRLGGVAIAGTAVLSAAVGIATTLLPALWVLRAESQSRVYVTGNRQSYGRLGRVLTGLQAALTVVVLSLTVILLRSYSALARVDLGFDAVNVITMEVVTSNGAYLHSEATLELEQTALESLHRLPDVEAAGTTDQPPLGGSAAIYSFRVTDGDAQGEETQCYYRRVGPGYVEAMRMAILKGRAFTAADKTGAQDVVLLNETAARILFRGVDPLGKPIYTTRGRPLIVVGVIGDIRAEALDRAAVPEVYRCRLQEPLGGAVLVVRTKADPRALLALLSGGRSSVLPGLKVKSAGTLRASIDRAISEPRFRALVVGLFGALVLVLLFAGVTGLSARAVVTRTREIGIRMAVGASTASCIQLLVWQTLSPAILGSVIGTLGAVGCGRLLRGLVFAVPEADPISIGAAAALLIVATMAAAYIPARRAAKVDPVTSLRQE